MAHHKSALKRIRTSNKANARNRHYRTMMRSSIRKIHETEDKENLINYLRSACSILDRLASKGIIRKNTAARRKSRLYSFVNQQQK